MTLSPIRLRAVEREARPQHIIDTETQILVPHALVRPPGLPMDKLGRHYLRVVNPYEHTFDLIEAVVERFYLVQGFYPSVIVLSVGRFITFGRPFKSFYPKRLNSLPIPYTCERSFTYDVIVRGEPHALR
jgi:hypothetical protein